MNRLRKARKTFAESGANNYVPLHPFFAGVKDDERFWRDLPDILQAQLLVMLDNGRPTKRNPQPREAEKLFWAATPHLRVRSKLLLFLLWMVLLVRSLLLRPASWMKRCRLFSLLTRIRTRCSPDLSISH